MYMSLAGGSVGGDGEWIRGLVWVSPCYSFPSHPPHLVTLLHPRLFILLLLYVSPTSSPGYSCPVFDWSYLSQGSGYDIRFPA